MNSIRESNSKVKRSKFSKIADTVKEGHRKDTERFTSKFDATMLKNASKKRLNQIKTHMQIIF